VFTRAFRHPCRVLAMCGGRGPGVVAALDPRLISVTPTGVGRAGIGRSVCETLAVVGGTFLGPLGRAGGMWGRWAGNRFAVRSQPCEPRAVHAQHNQHGGSADLCVRPLGDCRETPVPLGRNRLGSGQPPSPLGVHPSTPSAWGQLQGGGGADLCVRSVGRLSEDPVPMGREQIGIGSALVRWASIQTHRPHGGRNRVAGGRTSVSAPLGDCRETTVPMGRGQIGIGSALRHFDARSSFVVRRPPSSNIDPGHVLEGACSVPTRSLPVGAEVFG